MIPKILFEAGTNGPASFYFQYIRQRWFFYIFGAAAVLITNVTEVLIPKWLQYFLDYLQYEDIPKYLANSKNLYIDFALVFFLLLCMQMLFRGLWRITLARESHYSSSLMKQMLWERLRFLPRAFFDRKYSLGNLMSISTSDIGTARFLFGFTLVGAANSLFLCPLALYFMFQIDKEITLYILGFFLLLPLAMYKIMEAYSQQYEKQQVHLSKLNEESSSSIANIKLQKLSDSSAFWFKNLKNYAKQTRDAKYRTTKTALLFGVAFESAPLLAYVFLYILGLKKVIEGGMSIGEFVALQSYAFLLQMPFADIGFILADYKKGSTSLKRIFKVLNSKVDKRFEITKSIQKKYPNPVYEVKDLAYDIDGQHILQGLSFSIRKGEWLGIKGPVGTGKTTLLEILLGFHSDYSGQVKLFGNAITDYSMADLRKWIAYVPQKNFLFADTLKKNLQLQKHIPDQDIQTYLRLSDMLEDTKHLDRGSESLLGEDGVNLSGGQKQRLSIARALAQEKEILLMDDCLSAVDTVTEEKILQELKNHLKGKTLVWTAHRDSTLKYCDHILELG
tara:strand:- start:3197 stop:4882 length:1686 start_codon:yes stop_codon:yes gene_type:complete